MTTIPTNPTNPVDSGSQAGTGSSGLSNSGLNQLTNSQEFLQLLVAQLQNQDPLNPENPSSFMTEIAQMTSVQSQTSLTDQEETVAADSMIGQTVTGSGSTGSSVQGVVTGVLLNSSGPPTLEVGANQVALDSVTQVGTGAPASSSTKSGSSS